MRAISELAECQRHLPHHIWTVKIELRDQLSVHFHPGEPTIGPFRGYPGNCLAVELDRGGKARSPVSTVGPSTRARCALSIPLTREANQAARFLEGLLTTGWILDDEQRRAADHVVIRVVTVVRRSRRQIQLVLAGRRPNISARSTLIHDCRGGCERSDSGGQRTRRPVPHDIDPFVSSSQDDLLRVALLGDVRRGHVREVLRDQLEGRVSRTKASIRPLEAVGLRPLRVL